jgi:hypothetical protein
MTIMQSYSHLGGSEILSVRHPDVALEINEVISSIAGNNLSEVVDCVRQTPISRGCQILCDANVLVVKDEDTCCYWSPLQVDCTKGRVAIQVRCGGADAILADMAKFQYFFNENKADVGVEIVPCHALHRQMSSGVSYGEQLVYDIKRLKRHFPAVPVKVILVDVDK